MAISVCKRCLYGRNFFVYRYAEPTILGSLFYLYKAYHKNREKSIEGNTPPQTHRSNTRSNFSRIAANFALAAASSFSTSEQYILSFGLVPDGRMAITAFSAGKGGAKCRMWSNFVFLQSCEVLAERYCIRIIRDGHYEHLRT